MKKLTAEWVKKAEADYRAAIKLKREREPLHDVVCFHCQQCAEKYLKALLVEQGAPVPRTHNLISVLTLLVPLHAELRSFRRGVDYLTRFAVDTRYPGDQATKRQAAAALRWMERIHTRLPSDSLLGIPAGRSPFENLQTRRFDLRLSDLRRFDGSMTMNCPSRLRLGLLAALVLPAAVVFGVAFEAQAQPGTTFERQWRCSKCGGNLGSGVQAPPSCPRCGVKLMGARDNNWYGPSQAKKPSAGGGSGRESSPFGDHGHHRRRYPRCHWARGRRDDGHRRRDVSRTAHDSRFMAPS